LIDYHSKIIFQKIPEAWLKIFGVGGAKKGGGARWAQRLFCSSGDAGHKYIYLRWI
jgi:hypothetical protein